MPDAISASSSADGPTSGTTRMPAACAAATSARAGIGDARAAGVRQQPDVVAGARGRQQRRAARGASARRRQLDDRRAPRSAAPAPSDFRNARAGFGVLDDPVREARARSRSCAPAARPRAATTPSRLGTRKSRARASARAGRGGSEHVDALARAACAVDARSAAGRSARSGRRSRCARTARCRAPSDLTDAGAVVGLLAVAGSARSRPSRQRAERAADVDQSRSGSGRCAASSSATPGVEDDRPPGQRARAARPRAAWSPGLPTARPSQSATWSEPMTSASRIARRRRCAPWLRRGAARSRAGASPGSGVRRRPAPRRRTACPRRSSSARR